MARLIDADSLIEDLELLAKHEESFRQSVILGVTHTIKARGTIDAVKVVRCKDCKHYKYRMCELIGNIMDGYYHGTFDVKRPDDFCSYGVKKGGGEVCADD